MTRFFLFLLLFIQAATARAEWTVAELTRKYSNCLALVRDQNRSGSSFVARYGTKTCVFTNQHVVAGTVNPTFTLPSGTQLRVGTAAAAQEHDIMAYGMPEGTEAMDVLMGVDRLVSIGDDVVVLGNPDGSGVIHPLSGKVVGLGPQLVEISAEIVPGSSGSPVVHMKTGKVIAIASYLQFEKADFQKGKLVDQVRRFCYRLDSIKKWEPVRWGDYTDEAMTLENARTRTTELAMLMMNSKSLSRFTPTAVTDFELQTILKKYQANIPLGKTIRERIAVADTFLKELRRAATMDIEVARRRIAYDYFSKMLVFEVHLRNGFPEVFDEMSRVLAEIEANPELLTQPRR